MKASMVLYEGETFRVIESTSVPFFRAYSKGNERIDVFWGITLADLMATLMKKKPEWVEEIDMAGD